MASDSILDTADVPPLIQLDGVGKSFGPNVVLEGVDFELRPGEIHALCGENGAGKSTCLGLLYGLHQPSIGKIHCDGQEQRIENPSHAQSFGVSCVFQELSLAGALSVAENIYAGRAPSRMGVVDWPELRRRAEALLAEFGLDIDVSRPVDSLPISSRQIVEIAKALSLNSRVLLLDEPTSALAPDEVDALFEVLRGLTRLGIGIVYVSHHMSEIFRISDRVTVLRDGRQISTLPTAETSQEQVVAEMIGGAHPDDINRSGDATGDVVLAVNHLSYPGQFEDISFSIKAGEIIGMAGLMGARRSEIVRS
ncbi:MAG: sugar ABC transporter ATP-binding protein, partial [Paracoccaceae bacterium]